MRRMANVGTIAFAGNGRIERGVNAEAVVSEGAACNAENVFEFLLRCDGLEAVVVTRYVEWFAKLDGRTDLKFDEAKSGRFQSVDFADAFHGDPARSVYGVESRDITAFEIGKIECRIEVVDADHIPLENAGVDFDEFSLHKATMLETENV